MADDGAFERVRESLLTVADGRVGSRASAESARPGYEPMVAAAGVYERTGGRERLLEGPVWTDLGIGHNDGGGGRWTLDMRTACVEHELDGAGQARTIRFASMARPGLMGLRLDGAVARPMGGTPLQAPGNARHVCSGEVDGVSWMTTSSSDPGGGIAAAATDCWDERTQRCDRLVVFECDRRITPTPAGAIAAVQKASAVGIDGLLEEHRRAWARRWEEADVVIEGADDSLQAAIRFSMYHLISAVGDDGEAAVGARGLSGRNYDGHVFWDADVFTLPFLAATHPASSRAMMNYRIARLDQARAEASRRGRAGARFPWESASEGRDVTPHFVRGAEGVIVPIRSGTHEDHINADVAWACREHINWSGDEDFARGAARELLRETARYWASRVRVDQNGVGHIYGVEGPDEYHDVVDDNAYTNVMARWNLRVAAESERRWGRPNAETTEWWRTASSLRDGFDPVTGVYEQFAGFMDLEPLVIGDVATLPVAADLLLGPTRVRRAQVLKQPDVLMLHHLVPEAVAPDSLEPNLAFYLPRTSHGSSLSPAICAALLARAGRPDDALALFEIASRTDLDDLTGTSAGGIHLATMGGVWQALVRGFLGVRADGGRLHVDPHLPRTWRSLSAHVALRGLPIHVRATRTAIDISSAGPLDVVVGANRCPERSMGEIAFVRHDEGWRRSG